MAAVSATCVRFGTSIESSVTINNKRNAVSMGLLRIGGFPSLRTSRLQICAAKPETVDKVCAIVRKQLALSPETQLTPETSFTELGADSLDTVEIVMELEGAFDICVEEENSDNITTIQAAADLIDCLCEKKA